MPPDVIGEIDYTAYLDDELELGRRFEIEDHLARSPDAAARVMSDLRNRTGLRLLHRARGTVSRQQLALTASTPWIPVAAKSHWHMTRTVYGKIAAILLLSGLLSLITLPHTKVAASQPAYVADAVMAYHTGLLRARMQSQLETPVLDAGEILRSTRIRVPRLPGGWRITDVQVFPSDEGPSLQIMIKTPKGKEISIFAVRSPSSAPSIPDAVMRGKTSVAFWRQAEMSYALTGVEAPKSLDLAAEALVGMNAL